MHPLITNIDSLKENELEIKINELSKKYFQTQNPALREQIVLVLESYKEALHARRLADFQRMNEAHNKDLDKLINID